MLALIGRANRQYIPPILDALQKGDLSPYKDSMHPLIKKSLQDTIKALTD